MDTKASPTERSADACENGEPTFGGHFHGDAGFGQSPFRLADKTATPANPVLARSLRHVRHAGPGWFIFISQRHLEELESITSRHSLYGEDVRLVW